MDDKESIVGRSMTGLSPPCRVPAERLKGVRIMKTRGAVFPPHSRQVAGMAPTVGFVLFRLFTPITLLERSRSTDISRK
ncbi:hypothetical protein [Azospirillum agricola]|uniref:hypothetical protein n=1 Tax=Azospirillum agricola TaxID=1720247 RepID=UPI001178066F|nr:hypothetical protein [Azospirillum agricola]